MFVWLFWFGREGKPPECPPPPICIRHCSWHNTSVGFSFSEVGGGAWQSTVDSWLCWLAQLHTVLELVSTVHTTLNTPTLVQVTSVALSTFLRAESPITSLLHLINNRFYELRTPIVTKDVKSFIDGWVWCGSII